MTVNSESSWAAGTATLATPPVSWLCLKAEGVTELVQRRREVIIAQRCLRVVVDGSNHTSPPAGTLAG